MSAMLSGLLYAYASERIIRLFAEEGALINSLDG